MVNIGIYAGYWSTNIGNSFFQLGAKYVLNKAFPGANVFFIADEQGYIAPSKGNPANGFNSILNIDIDIAVILGPFIRPEANIINLPTLKELKRREVKIMALGVGMMDYTPETIKYTQAVLEEIRPDVFMTRDNETFEAFKSSHYNSYNGIDLGFFSSDVYNGSGIDGQYCVLNFDQLPEPKICKNGSRNGFTFNGEQYYLKFPRFKTWLSNKGTMFQILERCLLPQYSNPDLAGCQIIRTEHRYNPILLPKVFCYPNTISSDIPEPYWAAYKNTRLTISNRVHACVATLSFGNPAWLFTKSPRSYLLDRVGANTIKTQPTSIDIDRLDDEKNRLIEFIGSSI